MKNSRSENTHYPEYIKIHGGAAPEMAGRRRGIVTAR